MTKHHAYTMKTVMLCAKFNWKFRLQYYLRPGFLVLRKAIQVVSTD